MGREEGVYYRMVMYVLLSWNGSILTINVTLILQVRGIIFYAGKTYDNPFRGLFRGPQDFFVEGAETLVFLCNCFYVFEFV